MHTLRAFRNIIGFPLHLLPALPNSPVSFLLISLWGLLEVGKRPNLLAFDSVWCQCGMSQCPLPLLPGQNILTIGRYDLLH